MAQKRFASLRRETNHIAAPFTIKLHVRLVVRHLVQRIGRRADAQVRIAVADAITVNIEDFREIPLRRISRRRVSALGAVFFPNEPLATRGARFKSNTLEAFDSSSVGD